MHERGCERESLTDGQGLRQIGRRRGREMRAFLNMDEKHIL